MSSFQSLPTPYQHFIFISRYARWLEKESRRETWEETVERYFRFFDDHLANNKNYNVDPALRQELKTAILNLEIMPSMRSLMTAGEALKRDNTAGYNCSYVAVNRVRAFDEILYTLMCGTGVGFSVERQYVEKLPTIAEVFTDSDTTIVVQDSKAGWAKAFRELVSLLIGGQVPQWDLSKIRPAGARLKTFGGRASGPKPLEDLFRFTVDTFRRAAGRKLTSIECHDIVCKVAEIVVVGGVRRSALISLSNLTDERMRDAKTGAWWNDNPQRALANNSVAYKEKPEIGVFMDEWVSLYKSKSGERGIFNRDAAKKTVAKLGDRRDPNHEFGTNPCLHPDSLIETINGQVKIKDITEPTMVYSMDENQKLCIRPCSASWISKKNANTIQIHISSGKKVTCTPDHKIYIIGKGWIEAQDIKIGDKVVHLVRNRRGAAYSGVKLTTQDKRDFVMEHRLVYEAYNGTIPNGYDIHHIDGDTYNNSVENLECLSHEDHARLTALEQDNNHMVTGYMSNGKYGFISPETSKHGAKQIILMPEELKSNLHQYASVVAISEGPITDVYDLTVEDTHNFIADFVVVHNCSEIILRDCEFCNLTEVVVRADDTAESLKRKVRLASILGTWQASLTHFPYLSSSWNKNCEEEALLGLSLTGILDNKMMSDAKNSANILIALKEHAIETNLEWSKKIGINPAAAITCVKPSGTVSQLTDSASGIHPRHSEYYIRTVRADRKDPLCQMMVDLGFPHEPCVMKPDHTMVFSFPQKAEGSVTRNDLTAIEHLELWLTYQRHWCEHKPSITITVREHEWMDVGAFVYKHFDEISGISFLPHSDHSYRQAPYQDCTKAQYDALLEKMPVGVDWSLLKQYEKVDATASSQTFACSGDKCEVVDLTT